MTRSRFALARRGIRLDALKAPRGFADKPAYLEAEAAAQKRMLAVQQACLRDGVRAAILFEGWDASGKGGAIRRLTGRLDPRGFKVWPIGAPTPAEQGRHYLYRFWTRLPEPGAIAVFDRSWYGRVLVERIEGLVDEPAWRRAYEEINEFEHLLAADGVRVVKLFLHVSPDEQLRRFRQRLEDPIKRWKLTAEDFRNRHRAGEYLEAYHEMFDRTSTRTAPWRAVPGDDKWSARVAVMDYVVKRLSKGLSLDPAPVDPVIEAAVAAAERAGGIKAAKPRREKRRR